MNSKTPTIVLTALCLSTALAGEARFSRKPTAQKNGGKVVISFAVSAPTDAAVFVEDAKGRVVRHLAAGVLGPKAPEPFRPGLSQSIAWDGKADWGKPAPAGPFKVRVALGLGARYDKVLVGDPMAIGNVKGLAAGPDGTLYVVVGAGQAVPNWPSQRLVALNRDGTFQRTLIPPPAGAGRERIEALGGTPVKVGGRDVPAVLSIMNRRNTALSFYDGMAAAPDGRLLINCRLHPSGHGFARVGVIDVSGKKPLPALLGPALFPKFPKASFTGKGYVSVNRAGIAASGDGRHVYFSGVNPVRLWGGHKKRWSAVFRAKLPERTGVAPFFGNPDEPGSDETRLGTRLGGLATDGKGRLLICDTGNNRVVVVSEADGKFAGSLSVEAPQLVAADPKTGAVYVLRSAGRAGAELVKFASASAAKPAVSLPLKIRATGYQRLSLAVDAGARPVVLWLSNGLQLLRVEDLGGRFSDARDLMAGKGAKGAWDDLLYYSAIGDGGFRGVAVDHWRDDPEIHWTQRPFVRYNEATGETEVIKAGPFGGASGSNLVPGPDGNVYSLGWPSYLYKFGRDGKPLKWEVPFKAPEWVKKSRKKPYPHAIYMPTPMNYTQHTLGIRHDGHIFVFEQAKPDYRTTKMLREYRPGGQRVSEDPVIWKASDTVVGPRFDQEGNIYVAE
ncbi:MAG: hypothetical protein ACYTGB_13040, partial [Planctomycetota bacterium]